MGRARGMTATVSVVARRRNEPPVTSAPTTLSDVGVRTRLDVRELCARYGMDLAPALAEKRFYHVACRQDLENISEQGLVPSGVSGRERNFGEYDIDPECVYLWPSIGNAQAYAYEHPERFVGSARIIFQVEAPGAYESLCPDQEDLARHWEDFESEYPEEVLTRAQNELGDVAAFFKLGQS